MEIRIWLGDLGAYNSGSLVGEWLSLPMNEDELAAKVAKYSRNGDGEYFLADWDVPQAFASLVGEYSNPAHLNEMAAKFSDLSEYDLARVGFLVSDGRSVEDALDNYDDVVFFEGRKMIDLAHQMVDDGVLGELSEIALRYFDYEAFARDLSHDGYVETSAGVFEYRG